MYVTETQLAMESQHSSETTAATLVESSLEPASAPSPIDFGQIIRELQIELLHLIPAHFARVEDLPTANQRTPKDQALDSVLAMLLGQQMTPSNVAVADKAPVRFQEPPPLPQMEQILHVEQTSELESCGFAATGKVCLADGSERQFNVNGRIDSADAAYASLKLWLTQGNDQTEVESLGEAGIGALATEKIDTPFQLQEKGATLLGRVRASSVWLGEQEGAGFMRKVNLATTPRPSA
jgi:hypothetical protein